jgi:hypothetical protein
MDNLIEIYSTPEKAIEYSIPRKNDMFNDSSYIKESGTRIPLKDFTKDYLVTKLLEERIIAVYNPLVIGIYFTIRVYKVDG